MNLPTVAGNPSIYTELGMTKLTYLRALLAMHLTRGNARGNGNAANRRLKRLQDQHEAEQATFEWFDRNRLTEAEVDDLAAKWEFRSTGGN